MKNNALLLFTIFIFVSLFGFAIADEVKEPNIININHRLLVYEEVAQKIVANAKAKGLNVKINNEKEITIELKGENDLLIKIIKLRDKAGSSGWIFEQCAKNEGKNDLGIELDKEKKLVTDIILCRL
jgi:hypothetical protein